MCTTDFPEDSEAVCLMGGKSLYYNHVENFKLKIRHYFLKISIYLFLRNHPVNEPFSHFSTMGNPEIWASVRIQLSDSDLGWGCN